MEGYYYVLILAIAAVLGLVPANIAKQKGYSFGLWWFYGWMLFIVAIIHVAVLPDKNAAASQNTVSQVDSAQAAKSMQSSADELKKFKELLDMGAITEEEYSEKKAELLKNL